MTENKNYLSEIGRVLSVFEWHLHIYLYHITLLLLLFAFFLIHLRIYTWNKSYYYIIHITRISLRTLRQQKKIVYIWTRCCHDSLQSWKEPSCCLNVIFGSWTVCACERESTTHSTNKKELFTVTQFQAKRMISACRCSVCVICST